MPVGTYGTVKAMTPRDLNDIGAQICLGNTFHLWLRPGLEVIAAHGGLHRFMGWDKPDPHRLRRLPGVLARRAAQDHRGRREVRVADRRRKLFLTPEESMRIQHVLNSDIVMIFDECTPYRPPVDEAAKSMRMSLRWAQRSRDEHNRLATPTRCSASSRAACTKTCATSRSAGLADRLSTACHRRPLGRRAEGRHGAHPGAHRAAACRTDKPRYLMGVGTPEDLVQCVQPASTCSTA
jgi:queuine tRNA-ribosyltransferase